MLAANSIFDEVEQELAPNSEDRPEEQVPDEEPLLQVSPAGQGEHPTWFTLTSLLEQVVYVVGSAQISVPEQLTQLYELTFWPGSQATGIELVAQEWPAGQDEHEEAPARA